MIFGARPEENVIVLASLDHYDLTPKFVPFAILVRQALKQDQYQPSVSRGFTEDLQPLSDRGGWSVVELEGAQVSVHEGETQTDGLARQ